MIDKLLELQKITLEEYDVYMLYAVSEIGQRYFKRMVLQTFMETPRVNPELMNDVTLGFQDGRREIFREIQLVIDHVNKLLQEQEHDSGTE